MAVHGTGTPLGDPIEMGALGQALLRRGADALHQLTIGSIKSCYGHTEGAAGLTGALLALQAMRNQVGYAARQLAPWGVHVLHTTACSPRAHTAALHTNTPTHTCRAALPLSTCAT